MEERELRELINEVRTGRLSRRAFVQQMVAVGLTAPMAGMILGHSGLAAAATAFPYKPTRAGGGGALKLLYWQGATLLNPHFALGTKDQEASRIFYEPLAGWDNDGNLVPVLADGIPSQDDGLSEDGLSVVWKLKRGVKWHDGAPFTADDVVFNWQYARTPETSALTIGSYKDIKVEKIDDFSVRVIFAKPTPFWADAFVGAFGMIIPKHLFADYVGIKSRDAPANLKPVGTGPYLFVDFKPGDLVLAKRNPDYHVANRPYFDTLEVKGGGDAVSAARAVLQTSEYDYAWNLQVEAEILLRLESGSKGKVEHRAERQPRVHHAQCDRSGGRGRWRARQHQDHASAVQRSGGASGAQPADRSRLDRKVHLRSDRDCHRQLSQQPGALPLQNHHFRIQHRQGQPDPGSRRLEKGRRRHSCEKDGKR